MAFPQCGDGLSQDLPCGLIEVAQPRGWRHTRSLVDCACICPGGLIVIGYLSPVRLFHEAPSLNVQLSITTSCNVAVVGYEHQSCRDLAI